MNGDGDGDGNDGNSNDSECEKAGDRYRGGFLRRYFGSPKRRL